MTKLNNKYKMSEEVKVNGLSELLAKLDSLKENDVYILFTGSKDSSGNSWCPDCNDGKIKVAQLRQYTHYSNVNSKF
jgi:hypothetical protein